MTNPYTEQQYNALINRVAETLVYGVACSYPPEIQDDFLSITTHAIVEQTNLQYDDVVNDITLQMTHIANLWNEREQEFIEYIEARVSNHIQ